MIGIKYLTNLSTLDLQMFRDTANGVTSHDTIFELFFSVRDRNVLEMTKKN